MENPCPSWDQCVPRRGDGRSSLSNFVAGPWLIDDCMINPVKPYSDASVCFPVEIDFKLFDANKNVWTLALTQYSDVRGISKILGVVKYSDVDGPKAMTREISPHKTRRGSGLTFVRNDG